MDKTKSKLAAFFDNDDDENLFPQKPLDDQKLSQYAHGTVRKSKREKEKEAAEAKRREEEENAAKAYAEFIDAFEGEEVNRKKAASTFVKSGQEAVYTPSAKTKSEIPRGPPSSHGRSVTSIAAYEGQSGSKDRGDPETSNVFVANLPPHVTEQSLGNFFARVGPVGSVKIMWPRGDGTQGPGADMTATRRSKNAGLSGFVSFMKRRDAEAALREFDGFEWGGSLLRVGWSKAVPMAAKAMYIKLAQGQDRAQDQGPRVECVNHLVHGQDLGKGKESGTETETEVIVPQDVLGAGHGAEAVLHPAPGVVGRTVDQGVMIAAPHVADVLAAQYEETLREREKANPKYAFLKKNHRRYRYYRNLVDQRNPLQPEFDDDGYNSVYSTDSAEDSERERGRKNELGRYAKKRFEAMLRALTGKRGELGRCMAFSLEHAEAATEVSDIIISSLLVDGTPVPRKVARLHLICDILHNSAAPLPMAWKFRQEFQSRLGLVFDHLSTIYHSFPGRITAETFKKQITSVVDIWEDWIVFPPDFTAELRARLEGSPTKEVVEEEEQGKDEVKENMTSFASKFKASSFKPAEPEPIPVVAGADDDDDGEPMDEGSDVDGVPVDDVDGEPLGVDVDGEPMEDMDGEPMDDVDGDPLGVDVDGEPMDDLDGEPVDA
ncbi:hypothetical protein NLI96_g8641 [Meripilus lineatus]|uniref:U2 snRNP-associated SURP motif-containing protein n=1 Tax=Meripilus lineatus TaxID=2056292 RepID=A0AAD5V1K8_9APHY|nr:hypothetical protein NLI96_g8641 [Physisporinus lineatus]